MLGLWEGKWGSEKTHIHTPSLPNLKQKPVRLLDALIVQNGPSTEDGGLGAGRPVWMGYSGSRLDSMKMGEAGGEKI